MHSPNTITPPSHVQQISNTSLFDIQVILQICIFDEFPENNISHTDPIATNDRDNQLNIISATPFVLSSTTYNSLPDTVNALLLIKP